MPRSVLRSLTQRHHETATAPRTGNGNMTKQSKQDKTGTSLHSCRFCTKSAGPGATKVANGWSVLVNSPPSIPKIKTHRAPAPPMVIHRLLAMILGRRLSAEKCPESNWPVAKQKQKVARQQWTPPVCAHTGPGQCETHSIGADT